MNRWREATGNGRRRVVWLGGVLATLALLVSGCAGGDAGDTTSSAGGEAAEPAGAAAPGEEGAAERDGVAPLSGTAGQVEDTSVGGAALDQVTLPRGSKIIQNAELKLVVEDTAATYSSIRALASEVGGFVASANLAESSEGERLAGTVVIRVPAEGLDGVLERLEGLAVEIPTRSTSTRDVTDEYTDVEAQLKNLRTLEVELQELLAEVREAGDENIDQLFVVFDRLRGVRDQIDQLEGRRRLLDEQVALSTVTIHLEPEPAPITAVTEDDPWRPGQVLAAATATLLRALRSVATAAIWIGVVAVPVVALVALPFVVGWFVWRRRRGGAAPQV